MPSPVIQLPTTTRYALGYPTYRAIGRCQILKVLKLRKSSNIGVGVEEKPNTWYDTDHALSLKDIINLLLYLINLSKYLINQLTHRQSTSNSNMNQDIFLKSSANLTKRFWRLLNQPVSYSPFWQKLLMPLATKFCWDVLKRKKWWGSGPIVVIPWKDFLVTLKKWCF